MGNELKVMPIALSVVSGQTITIIIPAIELRNLKIISLLFKLHSEDKELFKNNLQGNEVVQIQNGIGGPIYVVEDRAGNILYSDKLFLCRVYRLIFGNNGPISVSAGVLPHFLCFNSPCMSRGFDAANIGEQPEVTE